MRQIFHCAEENRIEGEQNRKVGGLVLRSTWLNFIPWWLTIGQLRPEELVPDPLNFWGPQAKTGSCGPIRVGKFGGRPNFRQASPGFINSKGRGGELTLDMSLLGFRLARIPPWDSFEFLGMEGTFLERSKGS